MTRRKSKGSSRKRKVTLGECSTDSRTNSKETPPEGTWDLDLVYGDSTRKYRGTYRGTTVRGHPLKTQIDIPTKYLQIEGGLSDSRETVGQHKTTTKMEVVSYRES